MDSIDNMAIRVIERQHEDDHICYGCIHKYDCDVPKMFIVECVMYDIPVMAG